MCAAAQLYKQHFAADAVEDEDDDADGTPEGDEEGKEARKRQVRGSCPRSQSGCVCHTVPSCRMLLTRSSSGFQGTKAQCWCTLYCKAQVLRLGQWLR